MKKKTVYSTVYELCIEGFTASKICSILRRDKGQISRIINALVDNGFLVCVNPRDRIRFYEATKKKFLDKPISTVSTIQQKGRISTDDQGSFVRVHAMRYVSTVEKMGKVPWDKKWVAKETNHYFLHYPFLTVGNVGFEWVVGKKKNVLIIHMPSIRWNVSDGNPELFLRGLADSCGTWFMKRYKCDLRGLAQCGKGHFEMPVHDKRLVSMAQATTIRVGDFVLDASLGYPEFGSVGGYDLLAELLSLPKRVASLEKRMDRVESVLERIVSSMESMSVQVEKMGKQVDHLMKLFDAPKRPDGKEDVT